MADPDRLGRTGEPRDGGQHGQPGPPGPGVELTSWRNLGIALLLGGFVGWLIAATPGVVGADPPLVPSSGPVALAVIGAVLGGLAWMTYNRIHRRRERMDAQRAVALLVLGKASALAGALIAGGYLVFAAYFLDNLGAPLPRERFVRSLIAVVAAVAVGVAGLLLERSCRVPRNRDDDDRLDDD